MAHDDQTSWFDNAASDGTSAVGHLAVRVVSVLNDRQARRQVAARPYISNILERRVTARGTFDARDVLNELRCFQLSDDMIIGSYIPTAAQSIGERWTNNEMGFAQVTIASARLQSLLTEVAYCDTLSAALSLDPPRILVVICHGDQHTLGGFVVAAQLRRQGAIVEVACAESDSDVITTAINGDFDAIMFSCSRSAALESVARIVKDVRAQVSDAPYFVLGGIVLKTCENIKRDTGVDLVTTDPMSVLAVCEQRSGVSPEMA